MPDEANITPGSGPTDPEILQRKLREGAALPPLSPEARDALTRGRVADGLIHLDGLRFALVPPTASDGLITLASA